MFSATVRCGNKPTSWITYPTACPQANGVPRAGESALHAHITGIGHEQAIDQLEDGGFPRAASADECNDLPRTDSECEPVENRLAGMAKRYLAELDPVHGYDYIASTIPVAACCFALDVAAAHVSNRENARAIRFQEIR